MELRPPNEIGTFWNGLNGTIQTQEFNSTEAQKQRNWQENMSNTAYQRAVADMKKAGLNPSMMYGAGGANGASTPSAASASSGSGHGIGEIAGLINAASNLMRSSTNNELDYQITNSAMKAMNMEIRRFRMNG
ncbi:DNA pilot protein [Sigmofec virus UA08Rod_6125]|uniref:DNA pilot protein n=1 Tax=Sigmofec virus UA08Rod_6125 TaxID=2929454 RepID=A0A976N0P1_9VIRU|nr:DNA pilot protein [Sigmofec virus UA08Rod_6125]